MTHTRNAFGRLAGRLLSAASAAVVLSLGAAVTTPVVAGEQSLVEQGKQLAFDRKKGNCLACHMIPGGESPGNIGPPLVAMKARFPERQKLFNQIWDATALNPNTMMPPFGLHKALSKEEIDAIVEFLYTI
jgi:sulfur-oxidizing protein SoxX